MFSPELKKGSIELLALSLLEGQPRHGYEIGKLIEAQSGGRLKFAVSALYPTFYRMEKKGWIFYRRTKGPRGGAMYHVREMASVFDPGIKYLQEEIVEEEEQQDESGDPPGS